MFSDQVPRVNLPYFEKKIMPSLTKNQQIIVCAHGNSLRALCKKIFNITEKKIIDFEIPTGNPLLIKFKDSVIDEYKYLDLKRAKKILINV